MKPTLCSGAEIFAKRRKRSEKWVVDKEQCQTPPTPCGLSKPPGFPAKLDMGANENDKFTSLPPLTPLATPTPSFDSKPFYNPFTLDLSLESVAPQRTGEHCFRPIIINAPQYYSGQGELSTSVAARARSREPQLADALDRSYFRFGREPAPINNPA